MPPELAIIFTAAAAAAACAIPGTFLVLRRMSLVGDAVSHAVLPGIALAFLVTHDLGSPWLILAAGLFGMLTAALIEALYRTGRVAEDASIGVVFPSLFAVGVIIVTRWCRGTHLDVDCVLYGEIAYVHLDPLILGGHSMGPRALWILLAVLGLNVAFVGLFWKELKVGTFDPAHAASMGLRPGLVNHLLMGAVSMTVTAAFESVGAILVVAMLVVPPAAAYLLTDRLPALLLLAVVAAVASAVGGFGLAWELKHASIAGAMALMAGMIFLAVWLFAPQHGVVAQRFRMRRLSREICGQLLLAHLGETGEAPTAEALAGRFRWTRRFADSIVRDLAGAGRLVVDAEGRLRTT